MRALAEYPVMATLYGPKLMAHFLESRCAVGIVANLTLDRIPSVIRSIVLHEKIAFVNLDSCPGLAQDRAAVEFLRDLGADGIISTRVAMVQHANALEMASMQKLFITDRSTLHRSINAVRQSRPAFHQLMPWPAVPHLRRSEMTSFTPFIAGGFVSHPGQISEALTLGATGVSSSEHALWSLPPERWHPKAD